MTMRAIYLTEGRHCTIIILTQKLLFFGKASPKERAFGQEALILRKGDAPIRGSAVRPLGGNRKDATRVRPDGEKEKL